MSISFEGIGSVTATFFCGEQVSAGQVVKLDGDGTVERCGDGDRICGTAVSAQRGYAAVQVRGFADVAVSGGAVSPGFVKLAADSNGGVKQSDTGTEYLVVRVDGGRAVILL